MQRRLKQPLFAKGDDYIPLNFDDDDRKGGRSQGDGQQAISLGKRKRDATSDESDEDETEYLYPWFESFSKIRLQQPFSITELFQQEALSFLEYLQPTKAETRLRQYLIHKIRNLIQASFPGTQVHVFGSFATNLYLPNSDIDVVVNGERSFSLYRVADCLEEISEDLQVVAKASVPVIKFKDSLTGLKVDVVLNSTQGTTAARAIRQMISQHPGLRPLTLFIKHYLALRGLNEVFTGGLGGYAIVCLVLSFLQMHPKVSTGKIDPLKNLGTLLLDFLQLYGINFNIQKVGICVAGDGKYYEKKNILSRRMSPLFTIQDPLDPDNDLGAKSYNATKVVRAFRLAYFLLTRRGFDLQELLSDNNKRQKISERSKRELSVLSSIFHIPAEMASLRDRIDRVYRDKLWQGEEAAESFDWDTEEIYS